VESAVNQIVSKRFVKKQQMQWTKKSAHPVLQMRTQVLDGCLEETFSDSSSREVVMSLAEESRGLQAKVYRSGLDYLLPMVDESTRDKAFTLMNNLASQHQGALAVRAQMLLDLRRI
jgi:hypothetical protein